MSHRILLVDDEVDILEFVRYNLVREGYEVFTAQNGAEALKVAAECHPHLILLDMMMPVMDGAQTCRAIRAWAACMVCCMPSWMRLIFFRKMSMMITCEIRNAPTPQTIPQVTPRSRLVSNPMRIPTAREMIILYT